MSYILSCCSTADLSKEHFESRDIHYICFHYQIDGEDYPDDLGQSIPFDVFYERMKNGADTKTAQVSVGEYVDYFTPFLDEGRDIIHVSLSSGISGTVNAARNAAVILHERYPDRKIHIIDSLGASSGYGLLMDTAATLRDGGMSVDDLAEWIEANKLKLHHWFFSTDLTFFVRGGRISKTAAVFGGLGFAVRPGNGHDLQLFAVIDDLLHRRHSIAVLLFTDGSHIVTGILHLP